MVDGGLGHHGVVLELRLAKGRRVGGDQDELRLSGAKGLEGAAVSEDNLSTLDDKSKLSMYNCQSPCPKAGVTSHEGISATAVDAN